MRRTGKLDRLHGDGATETPKSYSSGEVRIVRGASATDRLCAMGLIVPVWEHFASGLKPHHNAPGERENGEQRYVWQKQLQTWRAPTTEHRCSSILSKRQRALLSSQSGPLASVPFTAVPVHRVGRIDSELHRTLRGASGSHCPFAHRTCLCGRRLDSGRAHQLGCWIGEVMQSKVSLR